MAKLFDFDRGADALLRKGLVVQQDDGFVHISDGGRASVVRAAKESNRG